MAADSAEATAATDVKADVDKTAVDAEVSPLDEKIIQQIEYYFGDINLPKDKFLLQEMKKNDGWVPMTTMIKFNRLRSLATDFGVIGDALRKSSSGLVEVSEDNQKLRRTLDRPLPENSFEYWQAVKTRSVYVKGFPQTATLDELKQFFNKFGCPENILMRRTKVERQFKGSVFVTYASADDCKNCLENATKFGDTDEQELERLMQNNYWRKKQQQNKDRKRQEKTRTSQVADAPAAEPTFTKGQLLAVDGLPEGANPLDLRAHFNKFGTVAYVEIGDGGSVVVRYNGAEGAAGEAWQAAVKAADDGAPKFNEHSLTATTLDGEKETEYWRQLDERRRKAKDSGGGGGRKRKAEHGRGGGRGGGRGRGRGGGRGGGGGYDGQRKKPRVQSQKKTFDSDDEAGACDDGAAAVTAEVKGDTAEAGATVKEDSACNNGATDTAE